MTESFLLIALWVWLAVNIAVVALLLTRRQRKRRPRFYLVHRSGDGTAKVIG